MERYRAHNWHCFGGLARQPYVVALHDARLPVPLHASAASRRRSRAARRRSGYKDRAPTATASGARGAVVGPDRPAGRALRRAQRQDRRRDVRAEPAARRGRSATCIDRARLRPQHLGLRPRGHREATSMIDKLARAGVRWLAFGIEAANERVRDDVDKGFRAASTSSATLEQGPRGRHPRHRQLHLRPARGRPRHDAGDARPRPRAELRVRELLLRDGLSRLAALRAGAGARAGRCPRTGRGYSQHSRRLAAAAARGTCPRPRCCASATTRSTTYFTSPRYLEAVEQRFGPATAEEVRHMTSLKLERQIAGRA